jgi:hypothetical protein
MDFKKLTNKLSVGTQKTSAEWYELTFPNKELIILDPDGWDRRNWQYSYFEELITFDEFMKRVMVSTVISSTKEPPAIKNLYDGFYEND